MKLDMQNKELQQIIMNLVGYICLYAQEKGLQDVRSVRDVQECFRYYPDDPPNKKNKFARKLNHRMFVGSLFMTTLEDIYRHVDLKPTGAEVFHAVAEALSEICDDDIKMCSVIAKKLWEINTTSENESEALKRCEAFMDELKESQKAMRKEHGND